MRIFPSIKASCLQFPNIFFFLKRGTRLCAAGRSRGRSSRRERDSAVFVRTEFTAAATRISPDLPRHPCASLQHAFLLAYSQVCLMRVLHGTAWVTPSCPARANRNQLGVKANFSNFLFALTSDWWKLSRLGSVLQLAGLPESNCWTHEQEPPTLGLNSSVLFRDKMCLKTYMWTWGLVKYTIFLKI